MHYPDSKTQRYWIQLSLHAMVSSGAWALGKANIIDKCEYFVVVFFTLICDISVAKQSQDKLTLA